MIDQISSGEQQNLNAEFLLLAVAAHEAERGRGLHLADSARNMGCEIARGKTGSRAKKKKKKKTRNKTNKQTTHTHTHTHKIMHRIFEKQKAKRT